MKKNLTNDIGIEINKLESENKKIDLQNEVYKKKLSEELKTINKESIINSNIKVVEYTLWKRIKKVLGMS
jgi:hypothetical protein